MPKGIPTTSILAKAGRRRPRRAAKPDDRPNAQRPRVVSSAYIYSPYDAYKQKRQPTPAELVASYRLLAFACANIIARACASTRLRLYHPIRPKGKRARWGNPQPVSRFRRHLMSANPDHSKRFRDADDLEEITDHPVLDAFNWVNPWMDRFTLFELHQLYLEIIGGSFWTFVNDAFGVPSEIWPLPSWMMYPQPDYFGGEVIRHYVFMSSGGQVIYPTDEILYQRGTNLFDPYTQSWSPLRAGYELTQVYDKRTEADDSWLTNLPKAGAMFMPNEDNILNADEMFRVQLAFEEQSSRARQGGILIAPGPGDLKPLSWPGRDPGQVAAEQMTRKDYGTIFDVPIPLIDGTAGSRANLDAAHLQLARYSVKPRLRKTEEHLNSNYLPRFPEAEADDLFLAFDDCAADEVLQRETLKVYFDAGWIDRNEARAEIGYEPREGGDVILVAGTLMPLEAVVSNTYEDASAAQGAGAGPQPNPDAGQVEEAEEEGAQPDHVEPGDDEEFEEGQDVQAANGKRAKRKALTEADLLKRASALLDRWEADDPASDSDLLTLETTAADRIMPVAANGAYQTNGAAH